MRTRHLALGALLLLAAGCNQKASDRALIRELKILGVRSDPPELSPGDSAHLDALVADPEGGGRPLGYLWALCIPDPVAGVSSCTDANRITPLGIGTSANLTVPSTALDGLPPSQQELGIDLFAVLAVTGQANGSAPKREVTAFKRVRVSTAADPNRNPRLLRFAVNGVWLEPTAVPSGAPIALEALVTSSSLQSFTNATGNPAVEEMKFTWLMTAGELTDAVTFGDQTPGASSNTWTSAPPARLWVVVRDDRGGIDWLTRDVNASP